MDRSFYDQTARIEDEHWWFVHRRKLVARLLRAEGIDEHAVGFGLDLGCGTGGNLDLLAGRARDAVGVDRSEVALGLARRRQGSAQLVRADACRLAECFAPETFDLVTVFNVLYHRWVDDDENVLRQLHRLTRPGGRLVVTEPAWRALFRRHDVVDHGVRRYTRSELVGKLRRAGWSVSRCSYFNSISFLPALLLAALDRIRPGGGERETEGDVGELTIPPAGLNRVLVALGGLERAWIARWTVPLGVGLIAVGRK